MAGFYINFVICISSSFELIRLYNRTNNPTTRNKARFSSSFELIRLYNERVLRTPVFGELFSSSFELIRLYNLRKTSRKPSSGLVFKLFRAYKVI